MDWTDGWIAWMNVVDGWMPRMGRLGGSFGMVWYHRMDGWGGWTVWESGGDGEHDWTGRMDGHTS